MTKLIPFALATALLGACAVPAVAPAPVVPSEPDNSAALASITAEDLLRHIKVLSSDAFEGRSPGTIGEEKTVAYLIEQFKAMGLAPGNPDGSYVQEVPLVGITGEPTMNLTIGKAKPQTLKSGTDFVATTSRFVPQVAVGNSEMVFVGYGVQAPEYDWDDYKGLDVKGKTIVMLINDPAVTQAGSDQLDDNLFRGKAMTYYGRWTYKYEIASKLGAAAAIVIHETGPAGYPWAVVEHSWTGEQFELAAADKNMKRVPVQAWISNEKARELFAGSGQDFDALRKAATQRDFKPVALDARVDFSIRNKVREAQSQNVVARLPGSDPAHADEWVVYTAHWDHLGVDKHLSGDQIFNGALDNATGTAGVLEIAEAYSQMAKAPQRSTLFMLVTAEEQGLLGSRHYATHPLYPLGKTLAMINMDGLNPYGPTSDMQVIGGGQNSLEDVIASVLAESDRVTVPDTETEKGFYFRSDQFEFAKRGVPALYSDSGSLMIGKPEGYGAQKRREYTTNDYHKPSDEVKADWDLSGAAQDMQVLTQVGLRVSNGKDWPQWKDGSEFKAVRDAEMAAP